MAASSNRTDTPIHETPRAIRRQQPVAAGVHIYAGWLYRYDASGNLIVPTDAAAQAGKNTVQALTEADNTSGAAGDKKVDVIVEGIAILPKGALTTADRGKLGHVTSDDTVATTSVNDVIAGPIDDVDDMSIYLHIGGPRS
jgi:hypothetical protein